MQQHWVFVVKLVMTRTTLRLHNLLPVGNLFVEVVAGFYR